MPGRKPKPTALKELQGNPGRRPLPENEPKFTAGVGECPSFLTPRAREEWAMVSAELQALGMLQRVDTASLAAFCQAVADVEAAQAEIDKYGMTMRVKGKRVKNPAVSIKKESMLLVQKFAGEFGFTPASRARVKAPEKAPAADPFKQFLDEGIAGRIGDAA